MNHMVECPECRNEIEKPWKEWNMQPKNGRGPLLHLKQYTCGHCGRKFRIADKIAEASSVAR